MSDSGNPENLGEWFTASDLKDGELVGTFIPEAMWLEMQKHRDFPMPRRLELPRKHWGEDGCHWYPESEDEYPSSFCGADPVIVGNAVSGPGFVSFCKVHRDDDRWGFTWWVPVALTKDDIIELTQALPRG